MRFVRRVTTCAGAGALITAAYLAGAFTAGLLAADTRAMAPKPVPISPEIAERVAAFEAAVRKETPCPSLAAPSSAPSPLSPSAA